LVYKSKEAVFNPDQATFMDFSVEQKAIPFYVCTAYLNHRSFIRIHFVFARPLPKEEYEQEIEKYIENSAFTISK
jgi:lycopene beta-cyclase